MAIVVLGMTTGLRFASATGTAVVHCCCGDHALDRACSCPDCPADRDVDHDPTQPTMDRCFVDGGSAFEVLVPMFESPAAREVDVAGPSRSMPVQAPAPAPAPSLEPPLEPPR